MGVTRGGPAFVEQARIERFLLTVALEAVLRTVAAEATAHVVVMVPVALVDGVDALHAVDELLVSREPPVVTDIVLIFAAGKSGVGTATILLESAVVEDDLTVLEHVVDGDDAVVLQHVIDATRLEHSPGFIDQLVTEPDLFLQLIDLVVFELELQFALANFGVKLDIFDDLDALAKHTLENLEVDLDQLLVFDPGRLHAVALGLEVVKARVIVLRLVLELLDVLVDLFDFFVDDLDLNVGSALLLDD